jgi:hypothetical protein
MAIEREAAIATLEEGHQSIRGLVARLTTDELERAATIGGGDWSARDLVGHLTAWEEHALAALDAWRAGRGAPILRALREQGLNAVNAATAAADRRRTTGEVLRRSDAIHAGLIEALLALTDATWLEPPTQRSRRPLGEAVGSILGGPAGPFSHAAAHLPDLERYVLGR